MPVVPVLTVIKHVVVDGLGVYAPGESIKPADAVTVLDAINGTLDDWAADIQASYAYVFHVFASTGVNPETIGPSGTWTLAARPVSIDGVSYDTGSGMYQRIFSTDDPKWWEAQTLITGGGVYGAYYEPAEPDGNLYFANPPSSGTNIRLMLRTTIGPVVQTDSLTLPQGYQSALELTVAEAVADAFHATVSASLIRRGGIARGRIFNNNVVVPSLSTRGLGLPGTRGARWDYRTGTWFP